jgi:hypothetical protein
MRILWVKSGPLHPLKTGGRKRTHAMLVELARNHRFTYLVAGLGFGSRLPRVPTDEPARNEVEQLPEDGNIGSGWRFFVHTPLPSGRGSKGAGPLFSLDRASLRGMAVNQAH